MAAVQWHGTNPYVLVIVVGGRPPTLIDLDQPGWLTEQARLLRLPGHWILARKANSAPVLEMVVRDGETPYYLSKGHGVFVPPTLATQLGIEGEVLEHGAGRSYGIGKTRLDGHVDRLWVLENGVVTGGDDVEDLGARLVKAKLAEIIGKATG